jgi:hypothetical protein
MTTIREIYELARQSARKTMQHPLCTLCSCPIKDDHSHFLHAKCAVRLRVDTGAVWCQRLALEHYDEEQARLKGVPADAAQ